MTPIQARLLDPAIAVHALAAVLALALGAWLIARRKGTPAHRLAGRLWVAATAVVALSAFWIDATVLAVRTPLGAFGPIHLLAISMLATLASAVTAARGGDLRGHRRAIVSAYASLAIAGALTLLPGRTLHAWLVAVAS